MGFTYLLFYCIELVFSDFNYSSIGTFIIMEVLFVCRANLLSQGNCSCIFLYCFCPKQGADMSAHKHLVTPQHSIYASIKKSVFLKLSFEGASHIFRSLISCHISGISFFVVWSISHFVILEPLIEYRVGFVNSYIHTHQYNL